jgi:hypothetical protein
VEVISKVASTYFLLFFSSACFTMQMLSKPESNCFYFAILLQSVLSQLPRIA